MDHTVFLLQDGAAAACGNNWYGQCDLPDLPEGASYVQVAAGCGHTVLLREDGTAVACGRNDAHQCDIPLPQEGETYTQVSAGDNFTLLLQSDDQVVHVGHGWAQDDEPFLYDFVSTDGRERSIDIVACAAGSPNSPHALLQDDGIVVLCEGRSAVEVIVPEPDTWFTQVATSSAGFPHVVCLRNDGLVVAEGNNSFDQCDVPVLEDGVTYVQVSTSGSHAVLLRSDGLAVAIGHNGEDQCIVPPLAEGVRYVNVAAGALHTAFVRSDGTAVVVGDNIDGQCEVPNGLMSLQPAIYCAPDLLVRVAMWPGPFPVDSIVFVALRALDGQAIHAWGVSRDRLLDFFAIETTFRSDVAQKVQRRGRRLLVELPDGSLLDRAWSWSTFLSTFEPTRSWYLEDGWRQS